jgi:hypothetical protein
MRTHGIDDLRDALQIVLGAAFAPTWSRVCARSGIEPDGAELSDCDVDRLIAHLDGEGGLCRSIASTWSAQRRTAA